MTDLIRPVFDSPAEPETKRDDPSRCKHCNVDITFAGGYWWTRENTSTCRPHRWIAPGRSQEHEPVSAVPEATEARNKARVVSRPFDSDCASGVCPTGCSHLMWACERCMSEGGWGSPPETLHEIARDHICHAPSAVPTEDPMVCTVDGKTFAKHGNWVDEDSPGHGPWYRRSTLDSLPSAVPVTERPDFDTIESDLRRRTAFYATDNVAEHGRSLLAYARTLEAEVSLLNAAADVIAEACDKVEARIEKALAVKGDNTAGTWSVLQRILRGED